MGGLSKKVFEMESVSDDRTGSESNLLKKLNPLKE